MSNLLSFVKRAAQDVKAAPGHVIQTVNNDVVNPAVHAVGNVGHAGGNVVNALSAHNLSRAYDQVNPLDNGLTASQRTATSHNTAIKQAGIGTAHAAGSLVQFVPQFAENYANTFANLGRKAAGAPQQTIQQNMGGNRILNKTLSASGATGTGKQLSGDIAQIGLSLLPGAGKGASTAVKALVGAGTGAGFGGASAYGNGANTKQIIESAGVGALLGGAVPTAGKLISKATPQAVKGATKVATQSIKTATPAIRDGISKVSQAVQNAKKVITTPVHPEVRANLTDQAALKDYTDYLSGAYNPAKAPGGHNAVINAGNNTLAKHLGVPAGQVRGMTPKAKIDAATSILDTLGQRNRQIAQNGSVRNPFYKGGQEPLDSLNPTGSIFAKYTPEQRAAAPLGDNMTTLDKTAGKSPDEMVTIYRGTNGQGKIVPGDFVTTNKQLAQDYVGSGKVIQTKVPVSHILDDKTEPLGDEYIYRPPNTIHQQALQAAKDFLAGKSNKDQSGSIPNPFYKGESTAPATKPTLPAKPAAKAAPSKPATVASEGGSVASGKNTGYAGDVKQTKFSNTVKNSPEVSPEVSKQVNAKYQSDTTQGAIDRAQTTIKQQGTDKTLNQTLSELDSKTGTASRDTMARAIELARQHDAVGTPEAQAIAAKLYDKAAEHASAHGQSIQILAAIARRSPAGLRNKAFRDLKGAGIDVMKPENAGIRTEIQGHIDAISKMKDGPAKDMAIAVLQKSVAKHLPQSGADKAISIWKAGLLSGVKTQQGNAVSNATFGALKKVSDVPASLVDRGISTITGKRTVALTGRGIASGTKQGVKSGLGTLKTGIDTRTIGEQGGKYEQHAEINFGSKWIQRAIGNPANAIFRGMSAADQPFYYAAMKNSLYDQAKADGLTKGLHGAKLDSHMTELARNPTEAMVSTATKEAEKSVLGHDTVGSNIVSGIRQGIDNSTHLSPAGKKVSQAVLNVLAPFTKVPSAFISRTVDFTPLGIPKTVIGQVSRGKFDQRALSQAIGEGATGTGIIALGIGLAQKNLLSGNYPSKDPKERQRWKAEGIQENSVKIDGHWISLNYLGPVGLLFNAGKQINDAQAQGENKSTQAFAAVGGLGQGLLGQSFLQGFSGFTNAITDPQRSAKSYANSLASSLVPSAINDVANATDKFQRQADTTIEAVKNRIPGLRETNNKKNDVYGNNLQQPAGQLNTLNGLKPSNSLTDRNPVIAEVNRLHTVDPNNKDLQVTPTPIDKKTSVDGVKLNLNDKQAYALRQKVGQSVQTAWNGAIKSDAYKQLDDTGKANMLNKVRQDATKLAQRQYIADNNLGTFNKQASTGVSAMGQGHADYSSYANSSSSTSTGGTKVKLAPNLPSQYANTLNKYSDTTTRSKAFQTDPKAEYQYNQAKYQNDVANGTLTTASKIRAENSLAKDKVGSNYDKNTRDIYSLSKNEIATYVNGQPNGDKVANDLVSYDQALYQAGIISKPKFSKGSTSVKTASTKKGGSKKSGFKAPSTHAPKFQLAKGTTARKQTLPKLHAPSFKASQANYKTAAIKTNITSKLRSA